MQVKQRLRINTALMALSVIALIAVLIVTAQRVSRVMEQKQIADALITTSFERLALRTDYMLTSSDRAREQVRAKNEQVHELLKSASEKFTDTRDRQMISALIEGHESIGKIFRAIVANRQNTGPEGPSAALSAEVEDRLLSQLNMRAYEAVLISSKLQDSSNAALVSSLRFGGGWIAFVLLLIGAASLINSWTANRAISDRVTKLRYGASVLGEGKLDYWIDIEGDDEFAELAKAFNEMALKLRGSYNALENEIAERKRTGAALRESESRYHSLFENMTEGFAYCKMLFDDSGQPVDFVYLEVNHAFERLTGLKNVVGKKVTEVIPGIRETDPEMFKIYGRVALACKPERLEFYLEALKEWFSLSIYCPQKEYFVAVFDVITERKQSEEALRSNEAILKQAGQMANLGAWEISISNHDDLNANPLHWSDEVYRIFGYEPGEVSVSNNLFFERVHPDDRRLVMDAISKALASSTPYTIEHRITRPDGAERIVLEHAEISYDGQGRPHQIIGAVQDITGHKRAEAELQRLTGDLEKKVIERTRFYSIRAKISEAIVRIHDRQSLFDEVCRVIVEEGRFKLAWVGTLDPESRRVLPVSSCGEIAYLEGIRIIAADVPEGKGPTGRAVNEDHYIINTDFEEDPHLSPWRDKARAHGLRSSSAFPLHTGGQVMGALTIYSDRPRFFTEEEVSLLLSLSQDISFALESIEIEKRRRAAEEALRVLNEELDLRVQKRTTELQEVNEELEAFIYSISHDLRAPLRHVGEFTKILAEDYLEKLDDQGRDYLRRIRNGSERMTRLIDDLLNLSKISRQEVNRKIIDVSNLARSVVSELRDSDPRRNVEVSIADGLTVFADARLIEIVLSNLLGNAWKFTSKTAHVRIGFGVLEQDGKRVYYVEDNGAGFDPGLADKMFWPFHRLHSDKDFPGTGIGLAIVERIVRRHGGRIWAQGEPGRGATIYFTLE